MARREACLVRRMATAGLALAAGVYAGWVASNWLHYGRPARPRNDEADSLLDEFMPEYDIVERHHTFVRAPPEITLAAAQEQELSDSAVVRAIFRVREVIVGASPDERDRPRGLLAQTLSLGWGVLADVPGREIVVGAVTKPWEPNVTFRAVSPERFAAFDEPGYVKIAWTLRADPIAAGGSMFRTETRAIAIGGEARARFRWYWAFFAPGIGLIRRMSLGPVRSAAERRMRSPRAVP